MNYNDLPCFLMHHNQYGKCSSVLEKLLNISCMMVCIKHHYNKVLGNDLVWAMDLDWKLRFKKFWCSICVRICLQCLLYKHLYFSTSQKWLSLFVVYSSQSLFEACASTTVFETFWKVSALSLNCFNSLLEVIWKVIVCGDNSQRDIC